MPRIKIHKENGMSILTPIPPQASLFARVALSVPLIGWVARDVIYGAQENIYYALVIALAVWVLAIMKWGIIALMIPYLAAVPVMFTILIAISKG